MTKTSISFIVSSKPAHPASNIDESYQFSRTSCCAFWAWRKILPPSLESPRTEQKGSFEQHGVWLLPVDCTTIQQDKSVLYNFTARQVETADLLKELYT